MRNLVSNECKRTRISLGLPKTRYELHSRICETLKKVLWNLVRSCHSIIVYFVNGLLFINICTYLYNAYEFLKDSLNIYCRIPDACIKGSKFKIESKLVIKMLATRKCWNSTFLILHRNQTVDLGKLLWLFTRLTGFMNHFITHVLHVEVEACQSTNASFPFNWMGWYLHPSNYIDQKLILPN